MLKTAAALFLFLATCAGALALSPGESRPVKASEVYVTDGDTLRIAGQTYRMVGYDTPEIFSRAQCDAEVAKGLEAKEYIVESLKQARRIVLTRVACACPKRAPEGSMGCNYGRACAKLSIDGEDLGASLISHGLARPYTHIPGRKMPPGPWCD